MSCTRGEMGNLIQIRVLSGHGQGATPTTVPDHLVAYMLHTTASAIVFLAEAEKNLP